MLAKSIIESDAFSDMPVEAQMLYVRLNLAADDDGFVSNPRSIMRMCGASNDAMMLLINKKFILAFEKGDNFVYLIKHWRIHNYIQSDRKKASTFRELLRGVYYDENKAYTMTPGEGKTPVLPALDAGRVQSVSSMDTDCIHDVSKPDTQDRLGKDRLEEVSIGEGSQGKGKSEGGNPPPPEMTPEQRKDRIDFLRKRIQFFRGMNWDPGCWYSMAERDGISRTELDDEKGDTE